MTYNMIFFNNFGNKNKNNRYFINLKDDTYIFDLQWNSYCKCAFLSISDYNDTLIISGKALTNGLTIRNSNLPYIFYFRQKDGKSYEATLKNFSTEFCLLYEDEDETE